MIDLHTHILPGLDDGAPDIAASLAIARAAVADGTATVVATPHVSLDYDNGPDGIRGALETVRAALERERIPLAVLPGAELGLSKLAEMDDEAVRALCLGDGHGVLVESPYVQAVPFLDDALFDLQLRGFRPVLAHPERCPIFQADPRRLARLAERGVLCSVTAGSMAGRFGATVRRFTLGLLSEGLVHCVASDAHNAERRPPGLRAGFERAERDLPGISAQMAWFTEGAPAAIVAGDPLPPRPDPPTPRRPRWRPWRRPGRGR